jgi:hypothetical protein
MNDVIEKGTAEEIGDLVGRYREVTGKKPAGAQDDPKPPVDTELSGAAKQAAEALAPVGSKRTAVQSPKTRRISTRHGPSSPTSKFEIDFGV